MLGSNSVHPNAIDEVSPFLQSDSLNDVVDTLSQYPLENLAHALNYNQVKCKKWLIDEVNRALGGRFGTVYILGGWYGVLAALLLNDQRFSIRRVVSIDIDPDCEAIANSINQSYRASSRFTAVTANVRSVQYQVRDDISSRQTNGFTHQSSGSSYPTSGFSHQANGNTAYSAPNLVINTSCEHMSPSEKWYDLIPNGMLQAYQTNNYFSCDEHVNCVESLDAFKDQVPMRQVLFAGTLERRRYSRFMLIGRK